MTIPGDPGAQGGSGRTFRQPVTGAAYTPIEAILDAEVVSWHAPYAAGVAAIHEGLRRDAQADFDAATAALIAADPLSRDTLAPAPWRSGLRLIGFLAGASTIAGLVVSLGFSRGSQDAMDASTAAVIVGISSALALGSLGSSLLFPSRMGTPNRLVSLSLWLTAIGTLGSALALPLRQDTWDPSTPVWRAIIIAIGVAVLVLASVVMFTRRRRADAPEPIDDDDVSDLRVSVLSAALGRSEAAVHSAWQQLDAQTRETYERQRDDAIGELPTHLKERIDGEWLRSAPPGLLGLPHAADTAHSTMASGAAQVVNRREPGQYGYFVKLSRRQRSAEEAAGHEN